MDSEVIDLSLREELFDLLPIPAMVVDRAGRLLLVNGNMQEKVEEITGRRLRSGPLLDELFARDMDHLLADVRAAGGGGRLIAWLRGAHEGVSGRMCFRVVVISRDARRADYYLLVEDKTKSFSRIFTELNVRLRRANEDAAEAHRKHGQLKENYRMLEQFSLVAAHDLKAPLLNIALLLEFLQEEYGAILDGPAQDLVVAAKESAGRLQELISALLSHARSGAADLKIATIEIAKTVETVKKLLAVELRESGGEIRIIGDLGEVQADPNQFGQLIQNLVSNALSYRSLARSPVIRIERISDGRNIDRLIISDNGRGFDPKDKDRLFVPFKRLDPNAKDGGTGVGLSICKTVCDRHGWTIHATGIPHVGATFEIGGLVQAMPERHRA